MEALPMTHVLVADDEESQRFMLTRLLKKITNRPITCLNSGQEVLEYLIDHQDALPHVILCDENMPSMGGLDLLKAVKHRGIKCPPIIILTNCRSENKYEAIIALGAQAYLEKSLSMGSMLTTYVQ
jgi:two-component system, chemotaxis family, chemotaxis protein CheY